MTLDEKIAALPKIPRHIDEAGGLGRLIIGERDGYLARLAIVRETLQAMVDTVSCDLQSACCCHDGYASRGLIDPTCRYHDEAESRAALDDARKVLEATKP